MELPVYELLINEDVNDDAEVNFVALVDRPAIQKNWNAFKNKVKFEIVSEEKRIISGPLMLADTPIFRSDATHGDYYVTFSKDTILKIAQKFFKKGYQANVNVEHNPDYKVEDMVMFESFISDKDRGIAPMKGFEDAPDGSWFGSFKVDSEDAWNKVKNGEVKGFSVEGVFEYSKRRSKNEILMSKIYDILKQVDFGGPGSGRRPENGESDDSINIGISNIGNDFENGLMPSESELDKLADKNPKAELIIREMINWKNGIYNPNFTLNDEGKKIFDKLKSKKNYELYRVDPTLKLNNIKNGDIIDFDNKPTYVSNKKEFVKNMGSLANKNNPIIVFQPGTKSLNLNKGDGRGEELIRGKYKIKDIKDNEIYVIEE